MANIRTFVAVNISTSMQASAFRLIRQLDSVCPDYRWVEQDNLHITLNFAGDLRDTEVPDFCKEIKAAAETHPSFFVEVNHFGGFPELGRPRTVWVGVESGSQELLALNKTLSDVIRDWGMPKEKNKYVPHVTLGRIMRGARWNDELVDMLEKDRQTNCGGCSVDEVIVYSSYLDRIGPTYTPMARVKLLG